MLLETVVVNPEEFVDQMTTVNTIPIRNPRLHIRLMMRTILVVMLLFSFDRRLITFHLLPYNDTQALWISLVKMSKWEQQTIKWKYFIRNKIMQFK